LGIHSLHVWARRPWFKLRRLQHPPVVIARLAAKTPARPNPLAVIARLDRAIQYAAAHRLKHCRLWNTGCPACAGHDQLSLRFASRHILRSRGTIAPELCEIVRPRKTRGRRECRVKASPMARQQIKKLAAVTTGQARSSGIPCAMVLTLIARSPRGPGFLAPV